MAKKVARSSGLNLTEKLSGLTPKNIIVLTGAAVVVTAAAPKLIAWAQAILNTIPVALGAK